MSETAIRYHPVTKTVQELHDHFIADRLHLAPPFQRELVWSTRDRQRLIQTVLDEFPLPALFLRERLQDGETHYDVIDGKQRIDTLLRFMGVIRGEDHRFSVKWRSLRDGSLEETDWRSLNRAKQQNRVNGYKLQVIMIESDHLPSVVDLFVRINSTGRRLSRQETRHALYHEHAFLKSASKLAATVSDRFVTHRVLSRDQIKRMKDIELIAELMVSCDKGDPVHKKQVLDHAMSSKGTAPAAVDRSYEATKRALNRVFRMFPKLGQTRFRHLSDFYSLTLLVHKLEAERCILNEPSRNRLAWAYLSAFGAKVDEFNGIYKTFDDIPNGFEDCRRYLLTVKEGTDTLENRRIREEILRNLIGSVFGKKDKQRVYSQEQRRIIWQSAKRHNCIKCREALSWGKFEVDHVKPHSRGGRTTVINAALVCKPCNRAMGDKRRSRK